MPKNRAPRGNEFSCSINFTYYFNRKEVVQISGTRNEETDADEFNIVRKF